MKGITGKVPYLKKLGITALWISPIIRNTDDVYIYPTGASAAYHGYWGLDFKDINERFGTRADLKELIQTCHQNGIKIILDVVLNHTSPTGRGCDGALYDRGKLIATYSHDPGGIFHHQGNVDFRRGYIPREWENRNLFDLADLNQENPLVDRYLKDAYSYWLSLGFDGFRIDAARYISASWLGSFADLIRRRKSDAFLVAEWSEAGSDVPGALIFEKVSRMHMIDFRFQTIVSDIFNRGKSFRTLTEYLDKDRNLIDPYQMMTCIDTHDMPRFISTAIASGAGLDEAEKRLRAAAYLMMTCRGIPCLYYGTEQLLHNETRSEWGIGADPYNRQMMSSFDTGGDFFGSIGRLAELRKRNPALGRGPQKTLFVNDECYIFSRTLGKNLVLTAVNKGSTQSHMISVDLPDGLYESIIGPALVVKNSSALITLGTYGVQITELQNP